MVAKCMLAILIIPNYVFREWKETEKPTGKDYSKKKKSKLYSKLFSR